MSIRLARCDYLEALAIDAARWSAQAGAGRRWRARLLAWAQVALVL